MSANLRIASDAPGNGRPGRSGTRSSMVPLETIKKRPGYMWTDFIFSPDSGDQRLKRGDYWIILRHSGEAIMNWFYVPGNPYGDIYDTRSTLKGYKWEDIQDYDLSECGEYVNHNRHMWEAGRGNGADCRFR